LSAPVVIGLDLDGTLLDSQARHEAALLRAARELGLDLSSDFARMYYHEKRRGISGKQVLLSHGISKATELSERWLDIIEMKEFLQLDVVFPGILQRLQEMASAGFRFCVATARRYEDRVMAQVQNLGLVPLIDRFVVAPLDETGRPIATKPQLTRHLGLESIIGDSEVDEAWAKQLGIPFLAVACGIRAPEFWAGRGIEPFALSLSALGSLFANFRGDPARAWTS
jgi:phosphoglycolate phosphatase-like HAD superfamily hydrolase